MEEKDNIKTSDELSVTVKKATEFNAPVKLNIKPTPVKMEVIGKLEPNPEFLQHDPGTKKVWAYDKAFLLISETISFESPLEKGVFHIPANCTEVEPSDKFKFQKFDTTKNIWVEYIPPVEVEKTITPEELATVARAKRDSLLNGSDFTQMSDYPGDKDAWKIYRQKLRDIAEQKNFPNTIEWPIKPI